MKTKQQNTIIKNSIIRVGFITALILMIPFFAMQLSSEWNWTLSDFVLMGILLTGTGCMIEFVRHKVRNTTHRIAIIIGIILLCLYICAELAVGIFTNLGS